MTFLTIITGTPKWVWGIFAYLIFVGIKASKPTQTTASRLTIAPMMFTCWSLYSMAQKTSFDLLLLYWIIAATVGFFIGAYFFAYRSISIVQKEEHNTHGHLFSSKIILPGSWFPLIIYMIFFVFKYCLGVGYAIAPIAMHQSIALTDSIGAGFFLGIMWGRLSPLYQLLR